MFSSTETKKKKKKKKKKKLKKLHRSDQVLVLI